jgi:hypothetical protein
MTTQHNDPEAPRGGCPSRLATNKVECLYCAATINRATPNRTCPLCAKEWNTTFGTDWTKQSWHTELLSEHVLTFGSNGRKATFSLDAQVVERQAAEPDVPTGYAARLKDTTVYYAVKDILICAQARDDWSVLSLIANKIRPDQLMRVTAGTIGGARVHKLLVARGFKVRGPGDTQRSPLYIPSIRTLESYLTAARAEIAAGDYFCAPTPETAIDRAA